MNYDENLIEKAQEIFHRIGVDELSKHLEEIGISISNGHAMLEYADRAAVLDLDIGKVNQKKILHEFALARRHAIVARRSLKETMASEEWKKAASNLDKLRGKNELDNTLKEGRERWALILLNSKLTAKEVSEVMDIWDKTEKKLREGGPVRVFEYMDEVLGKFDDILQEREDWGRKPHSPLQWWQWLAISTITGAGLLGLAECLASSGCSWILSIFEWQCKVFVKIDPVLGSICAAWHL